MELTYVGTHAANIGQACSCYLIFESKIVSTNRPYSVNLRLKDKYTSLHSVKIVNRSREKSILTSTDIIIILDIHRHFDLSSSRRLEKNLEDHYEMLFYRNNYI